MNTKILMVLTSHKKIEDQDKDTGVWLGEFTEPYFEFVDKGYEVQLASPKGGESPIDPRSLITENITPHNRRFNDDSDVQQKFKNTFPLSKIHAADYDAVFYPGGHGPMWDLAEDEHNAKLLIDFFEQEKPIGAVCHGPAALLKAATLNPELLKGKKVTAFSNLEEKGVGLYDDVPFKLEDRLKELGADYVSATIPFTSKVVSEGQLITGQNPASADRVAQALIEYLELHHVISE